MILEKRLDQPDEGQQLVRVRQCLHEIARTEVTRHRRRLGPLSAEQESAVEALLVSTVDQIFRQVIDGVQRYPEQVRVQYVSVWNCWSLPEQGCTLI
jgi:glutamyl-tRNA reductase